MKILLIDNYDSFSYNLVHALESFGAEVLVVRQDLFESRLTIGVEKIVLSPGPGLPNECAGMLKCLKENRGVKPILGVCLGMQALVENEGGTLYNLNEVKHGVAQSVNRISDSKLLDGLDQKFQAGFYHSWACDVTTQNILKIVAIGDSDVVMAIENAELGLFGVQFHPESILTPDGRRILKNFLSI
ncbi:MAG: aminodeoxychorismate/anthranilate synthase component II [Bacteroidetes bacterium]|nr:aminodeoxychorismate/anthranilate synthase component II [Bacteroidota bacterium]